MKEAIQDILTRWVKSTKSIIKSVLFLVAVIIIFLLGAFVLEKYPLQTYVLLASVILYLMIWIEGLKEKIKRLKK